MMRGSYQLFKSITLAGETSIILERAVSTPLQVNQMTTVGRGILIPSKF